MIYEENIFTKIHPLRTQAWGKFKELAETTELILIFNNRLLLWLNLLLFAIKQLTIYGLFILS